MQSLDASMYHLSATYTSCIHQRTVHGHPYYHVNPDILSPVRDPLSGNGCGSAKHIYI